VDAAGASQRAVAPRSGGLHTRARYSRWEVRLSAELMVSIASLIVAIITFLLATWIAFLGLRATAKPAIDFVLSPDPIRHRFTASEMVTIRIEVTNRGHWYAKPSATDMRVYVNVDPAIKPLILRSGWGREYVYDEVKTGKGGSLVIRAKGLHVIYGEPPELIEVELQMPNEPGSYKGWISSFTREQADRVVPLEFRVGSDPSGS
jgi:hypothetical protein